MTRSRSGLLNRQLALDGRVFRRIDPASLEHVDSLGDFAADLAKEMKESVLDRERFLHAMELVFEECELRRRHLPSSEWRDCIQRIRQTDLLPLVHEDPFTRRAFQKPRGYAGDAVMMDFIYSREENWPEPEMSPLGRMVFEYTSNADASAGVRARREFIARVLDRTCEKEFKPSCLAIACGHLREAGMSSSVRRRRFADFLAMDADRESLEEVDRCYGRYGVRTQSADIRKLILGRVDLGRFSLVYSTGLYDYLNDKTAQLLTKHLFDMLLPGGRLVIANFQPRIRDIGYMEACMDWSLVYRDRHDMVGLTSLIDDYELGELCVTREENRNIVFIEIEKSTEYENCGPANRSPALPAIFPSSE
jgi:hypothetical protein